MSSSLRHLPNLISLLRIVLVLPIAWVLLLGDYRLAIWLFLIAGASDGLDGFLAKRFGWASRLGGILDAAADKLLLVSTFAVLWWLGVFPWWLLLLVLGRDLLIVAGGVFYNFRIARVDPAPSMASKLNTVLQILLVAVAVIDLAWPDLVPALLLQGLVWSVVATVLLSGAGYVIEWSRRAAAAGRQEHG